MGRRGQASARASAGSSLSVPAKLPKSLNGLVRVRHVLSDPLKEFVARIPGGKKSVIALLRHSTDDEDAAKIVAAFDGLVRTDRSHAGNVAFAEMLEHADMTAREFVGIVTRCAWELNLEVARGIFAMNYPKMMDASMRRAVENDATDERRMHFQASGHVPTSKGIQIGIQNTNNNPEREPEPGEAPPVGRTARRIVRDLPPGP